MVLRLVCFCIACCCSKLLLAQHDTTMLAPVEVFGLRIAPYTVGSKVNTITNENSTQTLSDKLLAEASLYFKNYGNQQLSTVSFRGTTASQTAVLWNGINLNSPTLGLTDFSLVPLFLFDEVALHYGASGALVGNDAIGGSVSLKSSSPIFKNQVKGTLHQQVGSFGRYASGIKFKFSNDRWHADTRLYSAVIKNNFQYTSPAVGYRRIQENASVKNEGLRQQVVYKINDRQQLTAEAIYTHNFRRNQPAVTNFGADDTTEDKQLRVAIHYDNASSLGVLRATIAHLRDKQIYTNDASSTIRTSQWTALVNVDKQVVTRASVRWGVSASRFSAEGANYPDTLSDNRFDVFASMRYQILNRWLISGSIRQTMYDTQYAPFTPSFGSEVKIAESHKNKIIFRTQAGRAFRIPTLNDRFWQPGGNQNLKAEDASQLEAGMQWTHVKNSHSLEADVTAYQTKANEMIVWQPNSEGIWIPENLQRVQIHGVEALLKSNNKLGEFETTVSSAYSFVKSINKANTIDEFTNKQLPYVPVHSARLLVALSRWSWQLEASNNFTALRFTSLDNIDNLAPYFLTDAMLSKSFLFKVVSLSATFQASNILNVYYENLNNRAMPGRNYSLSISLTFNNQSK